MHSPYILPQELARPPIEEAVFEIRFQPTAEGVADELSAALHRALGGTYPRAEDVTLAADPARDARRAVADVRHQTTRRLTGQGAALLVGDAVVRLRVGAPFPGWDAMHARIDAVLDAVEETRLAGAVDRISLKFVNILRDVPPRQIDALRIDLRVNGDAVPEPGLYLRLELNDERYVRVVEIQPGTSGPAGESRPDVHGLLLALECQREFVGEDFWPTRTDALENLHFELRALFFRLLAHSAVEKLGPIYREAPQKE